MPVPVANAELVRAIEEKRLIEFVYESGGPRIAEPHDYGIRRGIEGLLVYQISGDSRSAAPHGWKHLDVSKMRGIRLLDRRFPGTRADRSQRHGEWDALFARVT